MNVGELRRALEGVSDTREVCFWYDEEYLIARRAHTVAVVESDSSIGHYTVAPTGAPKEARRLVFVIGADEVISDD